MDEQKRVVELLKKRGELGISKEQAIKYADEISELSPEKFNKLMKIAYKHNCFGTTCYKFLKELNHE